MEAGAERVPENHEPIENDNGNNNQFLIPPAEDAEDVFLPDLLPNDVHTHPVGYYNNPFVPPARYDNEMLRPENIVMNRYADHFNTGPNDGVNKYTVLTSFISIILTTNSNQLHRIKGRYLNELLLTRPEKTVRLYNVVFALAILDNGSNLIDTPPDDFANSVNAAAFFSSVLPIVYNLYFGAHVYPDLHELHGRLLREKTIAEATNKRIPYAIIEKYFEIALKVLNYNIEPEEQLETIFPRDKRFSYPNQLVLNITIPFLRPFHV